MKNDLPIIILFGLVLLLAVNTAALEDRVSNLETKLNPDAKLTKIMDCSNHTEKGCEMNHIIIMKKED